MIENEIWKSLNDRYEVSNFGRVKSLALNKYKCNDNGRLTSKKECILTPYISNVGYETVNVSGYKHRRTWQVHQLIAEVFIPNIESKPQINHIDGNKLNNRVDNLEWVTAKENTIHAFHVLKVKPTTLYGSDNPSSRKVIDIVTNEIFDTIKSAANKLDIKEPTLRAMLSGRNKNRTNMVFYAS